MVRGKLPEFPARHGENLHAGATWCQVSFVVPCCAGGSGGDTTGGAVPIYIAIGNVRHISPAIDLSHPLALYNVYDCIFARLKKLFMLQWLPDQSVICFAFCLLN